MLFKPGNLKTIALHNYLSHIDQSDQNLRVIHEAILYIPRNSFDSDFFHVAMVKSAAFHRRMIAESTD